jgi:hypothetical protein
MHMVRVPSAKVLEAAPSGGLPATSRYDLSRWAWWTRAPRREVLTLPSWSARSVDVRSRQRVELVCLEGELLVTFEGDRKDHIVSRGQAFRADRRGRAVIAALEPSRIEIRWA